MYSRLHASATAVVQLFFVSFARTILLSITTKSSSAKLYFFFDLAPYCHKKSLESICFGYNRHFLWGVRYHFIVWPNLKLAAVETVLKAKLIHAWIPNFQAKLYITSTLNIDLILWQRTNNWLCVQKMLNHGLNHGVFLSLFKLISCPI